MNADLDNRGREAAAAAKASVAHLVRTEPRPVSRRARPVADAVRDARQRRTQRRRRYQGALAGACALVVITAGVVVNRDSSTEQIQAGPGPSGQTTAVARTNGKIAFVRDTGPGDPAQKIYVMDEDGGGQTMIAETTQGGSLAWSPDGTKLAFSAVGGIYTVNADGSGETKVPTTSQPDVWPSWSPDGTKLAVRIFEGGTAAIDIVNIDGSGRRRLLTGDFVAHPAWSPDGSRIAYNSGRELSVINVDGSGRRRLTNTGGNDDEPSWSPDGRQITFRHNNSIQVINAEGGTARQLVSHGGPALADPTARAGEPAVGRGTPTTPQWSPDGRKIIYGLSQTGEACSIWIMNADGTGRSQLTDGRTCDRDPAWQPRLS